MKWKIWIRYKSIFTYGDFISFINYFTAEDLFYK